MTVRFAVSSFCPYGVAVTSVVLFWMATVAATTNVTDFYCNHDRCSISEGEYCERSTGRCNSCNRYLENSRPQFIPPECAYLLYYSLLTSRLQENADTAQLAANDSVRELLGRLRKKSEESKEYKSQAEYFWKWTVGLTVCLVPLTLVLAAMTVVITKHAPSVWKTFWAGCAPGQKGQGQEKGRGQLPDRLLQVSPTEEGKNGPTETCPR